MIEDPPTVDEGVCDGIHDDGAPAHHLCTRCFPNAVNRGDLVATFDEDDEPQQQEEID